MPTNHGVSTEPNWPDFDKHPTTNQNTGHKEPTSDTKPRNDVPTPPNHDTKEPPSLSTLFSDEREENAGAQDEDDESLCEASRGGDSVKEDDDEVLIIKSRDFANDGAPAEIGFM